MKAAQMTQSSATLDELLPEVFRQSKAIRRQCWDKGELVVMNEGRLQIFMSDFKFHDWIVTESDVEADDWMTIRDA